MMDVMSSFHMKDGYGDFLSSTWSLRKGQDSSAECSNRSLRNGQESSVECSNKDEARRSRAIAEQKFLQHDLVGAKSSALEAQCLYPQLEGIPQFLAVLDIHILAQQKKADGVKANWYEILQIDANADQAMIRKQYRKLALILHPDKNKAVGAEGAFKLVSEAWHVLSDKEKKANHDAERMARKAGTPESSFQRGFYHFNPSCHSRKTKERDMFRNSCPFCGTEVEHERNSEVDISCRACGKTISSSDEKRAKKRSTSFAGEHPSATTFRDGFCQVNSRQTRAFLPSAFRFLWGNHTAGHLAKYKAVAKATAEIVQETYEMVKSERVKVQKEARENLAKQMMEEKTYGMVKRQRINDQKEAEENLVKWMVKAEGYSSESNQPFREPMKRQGTEPPREAKEGKTSVNNSFEYQPSTSECGIRNVRSNSTANEDLGSCTLVMEESLVGQKELNAVKAESSESNMPWNGDIKSNGSKVRYILSSRGPAV